MKNAWLLLFVAVFTVVKLISVEAAVIRIGGAGIVLNDAQPIRVIIVSRDGTTQEQTVYYNPSIGGVDIDTSWAGPSASIYFPDLDTAFLWYNGYWVDQEGYYWDGGRRVFINNPHWKEHWRGYWDVHRSHGDWRGDGRHDHWRRDWHRDEHRDWREGTRRESDRDDRRFEREHHTERKWEHHTERKSEHSEKTVDGASKEHRKDEHRSEGHERER